MDIRKYNSEEQDFFIQTSEAKATSNNIIYCDKGNTNCNLDATPNMSNYTLTQSSSPFPVYMPFKKISIAQEEIVDPQLCYNLANESMLNNAALTPVSNSLTMQNGPLAYTSMRQSNYNYPQRSEKEESKLDPLQRTKLCETDCKRPIELVTTNLSTPLNSNAQPILILTNNTNISWPNCKNTSIESLTNAQQALHVAHNGIGNAMNKIERTFDQSENIIGTRESMKIPIENSKEAQSTLISLPGHLLTSDRKAKDLLLNCNIQYKTPCNTLVQDNHYSISSKNFAEITEKNESIAVVDPQRRKLNIPLSAVHFTKALNKRVTAPSLCLLYQAGHCRQGSNCYQIHADPTLISQLRVEAENLPCCCLLHGDCNSKMWNGTSCMTKYVVIANKFVIPLTRLAYTNGLHRLVTNNTEHVFANASLICRMHDQPRGCRFGADCKFLHLCRELLHNEMKEMMESILVTDINNTNLNRDYLRAISMNNAKSVEQNAEIVIDNKEIHNCISNLLNKTDNMFNSVRSFDMQTSEKKIREGASEANIRSSYEKNYPQLSQRQQDINFANNKLVGLDELESVCNNNKFVMTTDINNVYFDKTQKELYANIATLDTFDPQIDNKPSFPEQMQSSDNLTMPTNMTVTFANTTNKTNIYSGANDSNLTVDSTSLINGLSMSEEHLTGIEVNNKHNAMLSDPANSSNAGKTLISSPYEMLPNWDNKNILRTFKSESQLDEFASNSVDYITRNNNLLMENMNNHVNEANKNHELLYLMKDERNKCLDIVKSDIDASISNNNVNNNSIKVTDNVQNSNTFHKEAVNEETFYQQYLPSIKLYNHNEHSGKWKVNENVCKNEFCIMTGNTQQIEQETQSKCCNKTLLQEQRTEPLGTNETNTYLIQYVVQPSCNASLIAPLELRQQMNLKSSNNTIDKRLNTNHVINTATNASTISPVVQLTDTLQEQVANVVTPITIPNINSLRLPSSSFDSGIAAKNYESNAVTSFESQEKISLTEIETRPIIQRIYPQYLLQYTNYDGKTCYAPVNIAPEKVPSTIIF